MKTQVNEILGRLNTAIDNDDQALVSTIKEEMEKAITTLNDNERNAVYTTALDSENPAIEICKAGFVMLTTCKQDAKTFQFKLGEKMEIIDIAEFRKLSKDEIFVNPNGLFYIEALNHAIFGYVTNVLKIKSKGKKLEGFKESATAEMLGIKAADMKTTKGLTAGFQKVVDSIIPDQKVTEVESQVVLFNYSKWSNKSMTTVQLAIESNFRKMVMRILYKLVNGVELDAE